jgi:hypothetical protein
MGGWCRDKNEHSRILSKVKTPKSALQLMGVGLMLAVKYEEGIDYTLEHTYNHAARLYPKPDTITAYTALGSALHLGHQSRRYILCIF